MLMFTVFFTNGNVRVIHGETFGEAFLENFNFNSYEKLSHYEIGNEKDSYYFNSQSKNWEYLGLNKSLKDNQFQGFPFAPK